MPRERFTPLTIIISMLMAVLLVAVGSSFYNDAIGKPQLGTFSLVTHWATAAKSKAAVEKGGLIGAWVVIALLYLLFLSIIFSSNFKIFGEARFANKSEIKKAGLLGLTGAIVGKRGRTFLVAPPPDNLLVAAPTRSRKTQGLAIPNCLNHPGSLIAIDAKGELYRTTAGFRAAHGHSVFEWSPSSRNGHSHRYNPLFYIDPSSPTCVDDVQKLAYMLMPNSGDSKSGFFEANARDIFIAMILLVLFLEPEENRTLPTVQRYALHPDERAYWKSKLEEAINRDIALPHTCVETIGTQLKMPAETFGGIKGQYTSYTTLLSSPVTIASLSGNDFDLRRLRHEHISIYVHIHLDDRQRIQPLLSLFFQQLTALNTDLLPSEPGAGQLEVLLVEDEFVTLGRIPLFETGIATLAGYNLRQMIFIQNTAQLESTYSRPAKDTFLVNCAVRIVYGTKDIADAKAISEMLGTNTIKKSSKTIGQSSSTSTSDHARPLLLPQEIMNMPMDTCLIITPNCPPVLAKKVLAATDPVLSNRITDYPPPLIPELQVAQWKSVEFISTVIKNSAPVDQDSDGLGQETTVELDAHATGLGDLEKWIAEKGGSNMTEQDATAIAERALRSMGAIE